MFTIGADPELFFRDNSKCVSVIGHLGGSKDNPFDIGNGCAIQEDNVAAEFCIPPAANVEAFINGIAFALSDLSRRANDLGLVLADNVASHSFDEQELRHPDAQRFGCDPDYNAWTGEVNPKPKASDPNLRSAGGHVHVGTEKDPLEVIKAMDLFLGVQSTIMDPDKRRRDLYGKAGCYRWKPYGAEYRTLSNFWIWNPDRIKWVYHRTKQAESFAETYNFTKEDEELITNTINNNNSETYQLLLDKFPHVYGNT